MARIRFSSVDYSASSLADEVAGDLSIIENSSLYTGKLTHIRVYSGASGNVKVGLYTGKDNGDTQIFYDGTQYPVASGHTDCVLTTPQSVTAATVYGIAVVGSSSGCIQSDSNFGDSSYITIGYSGSWPDPIASANDWFGIGLEGWGYKPPTISSVNGGSDITHGDTAVPIVGLDFVDYDYSSTDPKVYLSPSSTFSIGTAVLQTVTSISDTGLQFTVDGTGLTPGTIYLFVETGISQFSTGFSVTLASAGTVPTAGATNWNNSPQTFVGGGVQIPVGGTVDLNNATQTLVGTGVQIPVGDTVGLNNVPQTLVGTGVQIPVGDTVDLNNVPQTFVGAGVQIPVGDTVDLNNVPQTFVGAGVQIPVGGTVELNNVPQTLVGAGVQLPVGGTVDLSNAPQTLVGTGVQIPVGATVDLNNAPQTLVGTGEVITLVPTSGATNWDNAPQTLVGTGVQIPVGDTVDLGNAPQVFVGTGEVTTLVPTSGITNWDNAPQTLVGTGVQIPVGDTVDLNNAPQTLVGAGVQVPVGGIVELNNVPQFFVGTGEVVLLVPVSGATNWDNAPQTLVGTGVQIPVGDTVDLNNAPQTLVGAGVQIPVGGIVELNNAPQTLVGAGVQIPVGDTVDLNNSPQTLVGTGVQIPVGDTVGLNNVPQTLVGTGVQIPVGDTVDLNNVPQFFVGTGEVITLVPTSGATNWNNAPQILVGDGVQIQVGGTVDLGNAPQVFVGTGVQIPVGDNVVHLFNRPQSFFGTGNSLVDIPTSVPSYLVNGKQTFSGVGCVKIDESRFHYQPRNFFKLEESYPYDYHSTPRFGQLQETVKDVFIKELYDFFDYGLSDGLYKINELPNIQKFAFSSSGSCGLETIVNAINSYGDTPDKFPMISITSSSLRERKMNLGTNFVSNVQYPARVVGSNTGPFDFSSLTEYSIIIETTPCGMTQESVITFSPELFQDIYTISVDEIVSVINRTQALYYTVARTFSGNLSFEAGGISAPYENNSVTITGGDPLLLNILGFVVGQTDSYLNVTNPLKNRYSLAADMVVNIDVVSDSINTRLELSDLVYSFFGYYMQKNLFQFYGRSYFERDIGDEWFHISLKNRFSWSAEINKPRQGGEQYEHIYAIRGSVPIYIEDFIDKTITAIPVWVDKESTSISRASTGSDIIGDYFGRLYK